MQSEYGKNPAMRFIRTDLTVPAFCTHCNGMTAHHHMHDLAHHCAEETHMAGSERYECTFCKMSIHKEDRGMVNQHLRFILD